MFIYLCSQHIIDRNSCSLNYMQDGSGEKNGMLQQVCISINVVKIETSLRAIQVTLFVEQLVFSFFHCFFASKAYVFFVAFWGWILRFGIFQKHTPGSFSLNKN